METKDIYEVTKEGYVQYGSYVNNFRHIPLIFDGLKPSYRRTIFGAIQLCGTSNKFIKTAQLAGYVIGNLHPHGTASVEGVIVQLVQSGIFEGQGNFGGSTVTGDVYEPAASRYTEVRLDPKWHSIFTELMPFVEWEDSYIGVKMPSYLPTPIPISLLFGSIGIGFGTGCLIPNFAAKSIVDAYKSNDPYKLYSSYKNITFDYNKCDFENLWNLGYALLTYIPKIYRGSSDDCSDGIYIETDTKFITPNIPLINERVNAGRLFTRDESDENSDKLFIGRYPKLQEDMGYYENYVKDQCRVSDTFRLYVTNGKVTKLISLKDWIDFTYTRYLGYIEAMKSSKINRLNKEIRVYELLPKVGKMILDNPNITVDEIKSKLPNESSEDISACLSKPIRKLMKSEFNQEINSLKAQVEKFNSIKAEDYTMNILNKM